MSSKATLIIDGFFFIHRARNKMGKLKRSDGLDTGTEYGFIRMLKTTIDELKPKKTFVIFDGGLSDFRLEILPEYKGNRKSSINTLDKSLTNIRNFLDALGINHFSYPGVEADDIFGLISTTLDDDEDMIIASSDTDFCQLISHKVKVYNPISKSYIESPVDPSKYVMWKAMVGDNADNIPGIPGIGEKKAMERVKGVMRKDPNPEYALIQTRNIRLIKIVTDIDSFKVYYPNVDFDDFCEKYTSSFSEKKLNFDIFLKLCDGMEFNSITSNPGIWLDTFSEKISLDEFW